MCPHCRAFITTKDRVCPYCNEKVAPRQVEREGGGSFFAGFIPHARFNTIVILFINFGLYLATSIASMQSGNGGAMDVDAYTLINFGAMYTPAIALGQWWRLVTAGFLHGGLLHILMNSWALFDLGAMVEETYGASRMLVIYFVSNVLGFYVSAHFKMGPSAGASAALFGLIGAMLVVGMRHRSALGDAIRGMFIRWLVYGLLFSLLPGIDMAAHVGGLVGGFGMAWITGEPRRDSGWREQAWRIVSWICILLTAFCFLKMYLWVTRASQ
jgi:rhomboid protease GluP